MAIAAEAGIAPAVHYADADAGVALIDFIATVPIERFPGGELARAAALGELARRLQETPPFPVLGDWRAIVGRLLGLLETRFAPGLLDPHRAAFQQLHETLSWDEATHVSSHNDPNPRNVLFDGERLWLIDWETSYHNDPMVDIAILADNFAPAGEPARQLLQSWLRRAPRPDEVERLEAIKRLTRLYYAGLLIGFGAPADAPITDLSALSRAEAEDRAARGELAEVTPATLLIAGKMCLAAFLAPPG